MKKEQSHKLKSILIWMSFSLCFLILLLSLVSYIGELFLRKKLDKIDELAVNNIDIAWHCNSLSLTDIDYKKNQNNISFKKVNLINIDWFSLLSTQKIHFKDIFINHGDINIESQQKSNNNKPLENFDYDFIANQITLKNTNIHFTSNKKTVSIKDASVAVKDVKINKNNIDFTNTQLSTSKGIYDNRESDYTFTWNEINTKEKTIAVFDVKLTPKLTEKEWAQKYTYKKTRTALAIPKLSLKHIDYHKIIEDKSINIENITLKNALLTVLANGNKEPDPEAYKPLLNELLYCTKTPINIKEVALLNNRIDIEVISKTTQKKALIYFNKINANIYDIQNIKNHKINTKLKALVLDENIINLNIDFRLTPNLFPYTIKGNVSPFNFEQFNSFLLLTKRVRIHSGECTRLDFSIYGDNNKASGDIILDYKNVEIGLFDNNEYAIKKLPTFLVNNLLIKQNNIPGTEKYRTGNMYYKRPKNRSMFHSWWFTLKSGFQSVILPNIINPEELDH